MITELAESYVPSKIFFRDNQIKKIKSTFEIFNQEGTAPSLLCQGYTGTGKTTILLNVLKKYPNSYLLGMGSKNYTALQLLRSVFDIPYSTLGKVTVEAIMMLRENPKIIILEEINKLRDKQEIKTLFDCLNTIYRETECPMIILTNLFGLNTLMSDDARKTLNLEIVDFPSYLFEELKVIFLERARLIKENHGVEILEEDVLRVCSVAQREGEGSARQVRLMMQRCLMRKDWSLEAIYESIAGILEENFLTRLKNMPEREKQFLLDLYVIHRKKESKNDLLVITYNEISQETGLSLPSVSNYIDIFENDYGLIQTQRKNLGRAGGNSRKVLFNKIYYEKIKDIFERDINVPSGGV